MGNDSNQTPQNTETYLTFVLSARVTHLWVAPYSQYQQFLFDTITGFREKGWNYPNRTMVEPERLQNSSGQDVSRVTRTFNREEEKGQRSEIDPTISPKLANFALRFVDRTLINYIEFKVVLSLFYHFPQSVPFCK